MSKESCESRKWQPRRHRPVRRQVVRDPLAKLHHVDPSDVADWLDGSGTTTESRNWFLRELWARPAMLRKLAKDPGYAVGEERQVEVAADVLRRYLSAPARMAALGQWCSRNSLAVACDPVADELLRVVNLLSSSTRPAAWQEGLSAWVNWLARAQNAAPTPSAERRGRQQRRVARHGSGRHV